MPERTRNRSHSHGPPGVRTDGVASNVGKEEDLTGPGLVQLPATKRGAKAFAGRQLTGACLPQALGPLAARLSSE